MYTKFQWEDLKEKEFKGGQDSGFEGGGLCCWELDECCSRSGSMAGLCKSDNEHLGFLKAN